MNKDEAIQFYTVKKSRARNVEVGKAYQFILYLLRSHETIQGVKAVLERTVHFKPSSLNNATRSNKTRRAIYRKALRELNI